MRKTTTFDRKFCGAQIERLMCFESTFPKQVAGVEVLIECLHKNAKSEEHARRIVDHLLDTAEFCPVPAQIRAAAESIGVNSDLPRGCSLCGDTGWRSVLVSGNEQIKLGGDQGRWGQARCEYASQRCDCARGQRFAAMDAERKGAA